MKSYYTRDTYKILICKIDSSLEHLQIKTFYCEVKEKPTPLPKKERNSKYQKRPPVLVSTNLLKIPHSKLSLALSTGTIHVPLNICVIFLEDSAVITSHAIYTRN